ncbi:MAG: hypothetical protein IBJ09_15760 [Bacteroidia bacterium]|nr:hypothetical protein [Bacteroidia bacterium]
MYFCSSDHLIYLFEIAPVFNKHTGFLIEKSGQEINEKGNNQFDNTHVILKVMISREKMRTLLKKTEQELISEQSVSHLLNVDKKQVPEILRHMEDLGFIETADVQGYWVVSLRGRMLVHKPMPRMYKTDTIEKHLEKLKERAEQINASTDYPHYVVCIKMGGTDPFSQRSKAIELGYTLSRKKISDSEYDKRSDKLRLKSTKVLGNIVEYYMYPHEAVRAFLQSGVHALKLREYTSEDINYLDGLIFWSCNPETIK